jgi:hypothetical protein
MNENLSDHSLKGEFSAKQIKNVNLKRTTDMRKQAKSQP